MKTYSALFLFYSVTLVLLFVNPPFLADIPFPIRGLVLLFAFWGFTDSLKNLVNGLWERWEREADTKHPIAPKQPESSPEQAELYFRLRTAYRANTPEDEGGLQIYENGAWRRF